MAYKAITMKKKLLIATFFSLFAITAIQAQRSNSFNSSDYTTALGVKFFPGHGGAAISLKHFAREGRAVEALGHFHHNGGRLTGLYEWHWDINGAPGLKWYVGPGAHLAFYNDNHGDNHDNGDSYMAFGIDGVIGLDYKFGNIPLNLSADWQPTIDLGGGYYSGFAGDYGGITVRYTF